LYTQDVHCNHGHFVVVAVAAVAAVVAIKCSGKNKTPQAVLDLILLESAQTSSNSQRKANQVALRLQTTLFSAMPRTHQKDVLDKGNYLCDEMLDYESAWIVHRWEFGSTAAHKAVINNQNY
jgi:hypothetical protein